MRIIITPLLGSDEPSLPQIAKIETDPPKRVRKNTKKIINNSFNRGDVQFDGLTEDPVPDIDALERFSGQDYSKDFYAYYDSVQLEETVHELWIKDWADAWGTHSIGSIPRETLIQIYDYYVNHLLSKWDLVEIFVAISEYLGIRLQNWYFVLPPYQQQKLLHRLNAAKPFLTEASINRIF
jgi:hypothetical protein